jgi:hypothetical protein
MLKELLAVYHPQERGVASKTEVELIISKLHINEMDVLQLCNLRDFVVIFLGEKDTMEAWDQMSAITSVIDNRTRNLRGEA